MAVECIRFEYFLHVTLDFLIVPEFLEADGLLIDGV